MIRKSRRTVCSSMSAPLVCMLIAPAYGTAVTPEVFAPTVISGPNHEAAPAFTPDGATVYFQRSSVAGGVILVSHRQRDSHWSKPQIASFSGTWSDLEPAMAPDGSFMVYISNRPAVEDGKPLEGFYNGKGQDGGNMWRVDRRGQGWSDPVRMPDTINRSSNIFAPAIVGDGSVYFMDTYGEKHRFRLYRSQYRDGVYQPAEPVAFSDGTFTDVDPAVAADESFMVFGSGRPPAKSMDLFVVRREGMGWGTPVHLGDLNSASSDAEPRFSPDLKTLYFSSERVIPVNYPRSAAQASKDLARIHEWDNGQYNIWSVPMSAVLEK
jgi:Tol biopolymer transport system component